MGWQPIETAPKDAPIMLAILVFANAAGQGPVWNITVGYWDAEFEFVLNDADEEGYRGAWTDDTVASWGMEERTELAPTHWQPLPAPPESKAFIPPFISDDAALFQLEDDAPRDAADLMSVFHDPEIARA